MGWVFGVGVKIWVSSMLMGNEMGDKIIKIYMMTCVGLSFL